MTDHRQHHLRMKDLLLQLQRSCDLWGQVEGQTADYLAQTMLRQLAEAGRLLGNEQPARAARYAA